MLAQPTSSQSRWAGCTCLSGRVERRGPADRQYDSCFTKKWFRIPTKSAQLFVRERSFSTLVRTISSPIRLHYRQRPSRAVLTVRQRNQHCGKSVQALNRKLVLKTSVVLTNGVLSEIACGC